MARRISERDRRSTMAMPCFETFLLDFDGNLYGKTIELEFIGFIRGDRKFPGTDALVAQMDKDVAKAREMLRGS